MADNEVNFEITASTDEAIDAINKLEKESVKAVDGIGAAFSGLKKLAAGALAFLAAREVVQFFDESIAAAAEADQAISQLENSLKSIGEFTPELVKNFEEFAGTIQKNSKFVDEEVIQQLALAKQLGLTDEQAKKLVQTSVDLATLNKESLSTSFDTLSKTLLGQSKALAQSVPEVKSFTQEQLKSGAAIDFVSERLRDFAKNSLNTFEGASKQASNSFGDIQEEFGKAITQNPTVIASIQAVTKGLDALANMFTENREQISAFISQSLALASKVLPVVVDAFGFVLKAIQGVILGTSLLIKAVADVAKAFLSFEIVQNIISEFVSGFEAGLGAVIGAIGKVLTVLKKIPGAAEAFDALGISLDDVQDSVDSTSKALLDLSKEKIDFKPTLAALENVSNASLDFADKSDNFFNAAQSGIQALSAVAGKVSQDIIDADSDIARAAKQAAIEQEVAGQAAIKASVEAAKAKAKAAEGEKKSLDDVKKLREEAERFSDKLLNKESDDIKKIVTERSNSLAKIKEFEAARVITAQQAADLRAKAEQVAADAADKITDQIIGKQADGIKKIEQERAKSFAEIEGLQKNSLLTYEQAEQLRVSVTQDAEKRIKDERKKALEEFKKEISDFASNPIKAVIGEIEVDPKALEKIGPAIAGSLGALNNILQGKGGAEALTKNLAGTFADALIPGIGPVVSEIVGVLQKGPEEVKKFIQEFVDTLPTLISNIAEAIPAVLVGLVESLLAKGGLVKIIDSLVKAIPTIIKGLIAAVPQLVKELVKAAPEVGLALAEAFFDPKLITEVINELVNQVPVVIQSLVDGIPYFIQSFVDNVPAIINALVANLPTLIQAIISAVPQIIQSVILAIPQIIQALIAGIPQIISTVVQNVPQIITALVQGIPQIITTFVSNVPQIITALTQAAPAIAEALIRESPRISLELAKAGPEIAIGIIKNTPQIARALVDSFLAIFRWPGFPDFRWPSFPPFRFPDIPEPQWVRDFKNFLANFKIEIPGVSGGGGGGGIASIGKKLGFAEGGLVPGGFPNDTFPARLTSGELVVPRDLVSGLEGLITRDEAGSRGSTADGVQLALLNRIANLLEQPMSVATTAEVDGRALADIILQLNRQNARLQA